MKKDAIQIENSNEDIKGTYANMAQILHTKEEFVIDFLNVIPPRGTLNSRVIVSPSHFKRIASAMHNNLKKYEEKFGKVDENDDEEYDIDLN